MKHIVEVGVIALLTFAFGVIVLNIITGCSRDNPAGCIFIGW